MENGYTDDLTIDRINNDGNYEPNNCRWVDMFVQANNKRTNRYIEYNGEKYTISELARKINMKYATVRNRIVNLGWKIEDVVNIPPITTRIYKKKDKNNKEKQSDVCT